MVSVARDLDRSDNAGARGSEERAARGTGGPPCDLAREALLDAPIDRASSTAFAAAHEDALTFRGWSEQQ